MKMEDWLREQADRCGGSKKVTMYAIAARLEQLEQEDEITETVTRNMSDILTRVANILKGDPGKLTLHDWSDLPEVAERLKRENAELKRAALGPNPSEKEIFQAGFNAGLRENNGTIGPERKEADAE